MAEPETTQINAEILDDPERHHAVDPDGMHAAIRGFPDQLRQARSLVDQVKWTDFKPTTPAGICLCGMGGSAIGGDLARAYWEYDSTIPFIIVRNDRLPAAVNRFWLVIASSYSGNTAETLAATEEARKRGCTVLAMTTGGILRSMAQSHGWPFITLPGGLVPRAALGYSFGPVMLALARWGVVPDLADEISSSASFLEKRTKEFDSVRPLADNVAKLHAATLAHRLIAVYGSTGTTDVIASRIKGQFCENSKAASFANVLPELNHNEIVGMDAAQIAHQSMALVTLATADDSPLAERRREWIERRLHDRGLPVITIKAVGETRLQRMLSLVQSGDYISYHLAILTGQDPSPVPAINDLKSDMSPKD